MKIKKIIDVCKKEGGLSLLTPEEGPQYIAAAQARYALVGLPPVTMGGLCALYDLKPEEGFSVEEIFGKIELTGDEPLVELPLNLKAEATVVPFKAKDGTVYLIREKYMSPFAKDREISCVLKRDTFGKPSVVFRAGLSEIAEIDPITPSEDFVSMLEMILSGVDDFLGQEEKRTEKLPPLDYEEEVLR